MKSKNNKEILIKKLFKKEWKKWNLNKEKEE
jgi:hypothetical protein